jgi:hypothetical protein
MQPVEQQKKKSPWLYVGIGCGALVLMGIIATVAAVMFGVNKLQQYKEDMSNPVTRTEKVKAVLGADTLPEGYSAVMALSVPMVMDTALLSTRAPGAPAPTTPSEVRSFLYFWLKASTVNDAEELTAYLEGRSDDASVLTRNKIRINTREIIRRGAIRFGERRVLYLAQRGELQSQSHSSQGPGINALILFECPGQTALRLGLWMSPDPSPGTPLQQLDLEGTPADEAALRDFTAHFNPCQVK